MSDLNDSPSLPPPGPEFTASNPASWVTAIKSRTGLDRAILFTVFGRVLQGAGSIVTVLLLVRFLTPVEQGYYYALWSMVTLQIIFDLGFSFVVLQIAAHERAHLTFLPDGSVVGDDRAHGRLAAILQWSVRAYLMIAVVMGIAMLLGGAHFFASRQPGSEAIWVWPLRATVLACCMTFFIGPVISFLEGSGMVIDVARMRFVQSLVSSTMALTAMLTHHGLFAPAMVLSGQGVIAASLVVIKRGYLLPLMVKKVGDGLINWRDEVWPFQWKIAVSWMCDYFIFQLFTPVLFAFRGPVEAGRMGISMSAVTQLSGIVLAWMSTKAAPFGTMVARGETPQLDRLFFRTLRQSLALFASGAVVLLSIAVALPRFAPRIGQRIAPWPIFLLLLLTAASSHVVQSEALYLRSHKVEPFLIQSIVVASATVSLLLLTAKPYGSMGVALSFFFVLGIGGLISASLIFFRMRRRWASSELEAPLVSLHENLSPSSGGQVSVVMCTYNGSRFLRQQLQSIAAQTLLPVELVVCDDCSADETISILEIFAGEAPFPVLIHRNPKQLGSTRNFQLGISRAHGALIALCDQDDLWESYKLETLTKLMQQNDLSGVFTDAKLIDDEGRRLKGTLWSRGHLSPKKQLLFFRDPAGLLLRQDVATGATMIFKASVRDFYHEIPSEWFHDGWLAWMMVLHTGRVGRLLLSKDQLTIYRIHAAQQTGQESARLGSNAEPIRQRLNKSRQFGTIQARATARRFTLLLEHLRESQGMEDSEIAKRLKEAIAFQNGRAKLSTAGFARALEVLRTLPAYFRYARGLSTAAKDIWT